MVASRTAGRRAPPAGDRSASRTRARPGWCTAASSRPCSTTSSPGRSRAAGRGGLTATLTVTYRRPVHLGRAARRHAASWHDDGRRTTATARIVAEDDPRIDAGRGEATLVALRAERAADVFAPTGRDVRRLDQPRADPASVRPGARRVRRVAGRIQGGPPAGWQQRAGCAARRGPAPRRTGRAPRRCGGPAPSPAACGRGWCPGPGAAVPMSSHPGSVGTRCAANAACSAARSGERGHRHAHRAQRAGEGVGVQQRLGGEVERAGCAPVEHPLDGVGDVVGVDERHRQGGQGQRQQPGHRTGEQPGGAEQPAGRGSTGRSRCRPTAAAPASAGRRSA